MLCNCRQLYSIREIKIKVWNYSGLVCARCSFYGVCIEKNVSLDKNRPITRLLKTQVYIFLFLIQILHCYYFPLKNERLFPFNIKGNINQLGIHNLFYLTLQLHSELEIEKKHAVVCKPTQMLKKCKIDFCELFFLILLSERNRNI